MSVLKNGFAAFSVLGLSACVSQPTMWSTKDLKMNPANGTLAYELGNFSSSPIKDIKGTVQIYVDDQLLQTSTLQSIVDANTALKTPRHVALIDSGIKLSGTERKVLVKLSGTEDANLFRKFRTQMIDFTKTVNGDLQVLSMDITPGSTGGSQVLSVTLKNNGPLIATANKQVRIELNGQPVPGGDPLTASITNLAAGGTITQTITLPASFQIPDPVNMKANLLEVDDDISNNNFSRFSISNSALDAKYAAILETATIGENLIWIPSGDDSPCPYKIWTAPMKNDLKAALKKLEQGESIDNNLNRPEPNLYTADKAWKVYVSIVAQSLWVEANRKVDWSIFDYTDDNLRLLLDGRSWFKPVRVGSVLKYQLWDTRSGSVENIDPKMNYNFMVNGQLLWPAKNMTIQSVTDWLRGHGSHFVTGGLVPANAPENLSDEEKSRLAQWGTTTTPSMKDTLYPKVRSFKRNALSGQSSDVTIKNVIVAGCQGAVGIYKALLASVNIPVKPSVSFIDTPIINQTTHELVGHNTPFFPSEDLHLTHGDDPYMLAGVVMDSVVPAAPTYKMHLTTPELNAMMTNCLGASDVNACKDQNARRRIKYFVTQAIESDSWFFMSVYAKNGDETHLANMIKNFDNLPGLFSEAETNALVARVRTATLDFGKKLGGTSNGDKRLRVHNELQERLRDRSQLM